MTDSYTILAQSYDRLTADVDYKKWADYIERHFQRQKQPVRTVAELGCGTGNLTSLLARRGYAMTAVDLSPDMLSIAQQKCGGLDILFLCQDMSRLTLLEPADAVVSCLDSINYIPRPAALRRTFQRVHRALVPGGLFLFDVKTPAALEGAGGQIYLDEDEETVYDFSCFVDANVAYSINAPELVTVAERDKALLTFRDEMQNYLNGLSEEEIAGSDIKKMLKTKSAELANSLSTENMKLSPCDIYMIEIHNAGTEISK